MSVKGGAGGKVAKRVDLTRAGSSVISTWDVEGEVWLVASNKGEGKCYASRGTDVVWEGKALNHLEALDQAVQNAPPVDVKPVPKAAEAPKVEPAPAPAEPPKVSKKKTAKKKVAKKGSAAK